MHLDSPSLYTSEISSADTISMGGFSFSIHHLFYHGYLSRLIFHPLKLNLFAP